MSLRQNLRIDAIRRQPAVDQTLNVVDHDIRHLLAHLDDRAADVRREDDIGHAAERLVDLGFVLEHVEAGAGDLFALESAHQRGLIHDRATGRVDQKG